MRLPKAVRAGPNETLFPEWCRNNCKLARIFASTKGYQDCSPPSVQDCIASRPQTRLFWILAATTVATRAQCSWQCRLQRSIASSRNREPSSDSGSASVATSKRLDCSRLPSANATDIQFFIRAAAVIRWKVGSVGLDTTTQVPSGRYPWCKFETTITVDSLRLDNWCV